MSDYLASGHIVTDEVVSKSGERSEYNIGGPALYAVAGIRLFTKSVKMVSRVGADFYDNDSYINWFKRNGVSDESVLVVSENCNRFTLQYSDDGYREISRSVYGDTNLGYMRTKPEDIERAASKETKGLYFTSGVDKVIWQKMADIKSKYDFKIAFELEHWNSRNDIEKVKEILQISNIFSVNKYEASKLFSIDANDDKRMIEELIKLPSECILYRVSSKGSYLISNGRVCFSPSLNIMPFVDETGCGNTAVAAALYAFCEGGSAEEILSYANVAASVCAAAMGPYPHLDDAIMKKAIETVNHHTLKCVEIK